MIGVLIQGRTATEAVAQVEQAEEAGVPAAWATMGGAGGADMLATFAAAATKTSRILLGTAILHTWPRHPVVFAQEALAIDQLAPGRLRLGLGPGGAPAVERSYGIEFRAPLTNVREYVTTLRALLHDGEATFAGTHVRVQHRLGQTAAVPVMAAALRERAFALAGEVADGAISWLGPRGYLVRHALPALRAGAERAGRATPPLVAHVPVAVTADREAARALAREQFAFFLRPPAYREMFAQAGFPPDDGFSDALLDELVVSGTRDEVAAGLRGWLDAGMGEVIAHPLIDAADREGSIARAFEAAAAAH
ncbi:MAG: LLM class flavin-dependent oxidoreductase [Dehalococcoidia bacterium]|nr:LLM class flavin-dependent oxidoreductase [Dehalococcoidia bacterium]